MNTYTNKILVLGVGNLLLADEGIGVLVVEALRTRYSFPPHVELLDGGTLGLDLLYYLEGVDRLLIVDAVETGRPAGSVIRLADEQVPAFLARKVSPHQVGIPDMLFAAQLRDLYPQQIVLWGVQPAWLELGLDLSPPVAARLDFLVEAVCAELTAWGVESTSRAAPTTPSGTLP